jgi:hypothetical protein
MTYIEMSSSGVSSTPTKRPRDDTVTSESFDIWGQVLRIWTRLLKPEEDSSSKKYRFLLCGSNTDEVVDVVQIASDGLNSEIYEVYTNHREHYPVIMKRFLPDPEIESLSSDIEIKLQRYVSSQGFAPRVLAANRTAMIMEKCDEPLKNKPLPDGYTYTRGLPRTVTRELGTINKVLGTGIQSILQLGRQLYDTLGLYNEDPNVDNYMDLKSRLVAIDFGKYRFKDKESLSKMSTAMKLQKALVVEDRPAYPPDYYWYQTFMSSSSEPDDKRNWTRAQWRAFTGALPARRAHLIALLEPNQSELNAACSNPKPLVQDAYFRTYIACM